MTDQSPDKKTPEATTDSSLEPPIEAALERPADQPTEPVEIPEEEWRAGAESDADFAEAETPQPDSGDGAATATSAAAAAGESKAKPANLRWDGYFFLLLFAVSLLRLGYLYIVPLDLGPDESYYWDWSRRLDLGYYSKPPMIAWVNALSTALLGITPQAVRMPAVVFGAVGLLGMYLCGRRLFNAEVAFWGVAAWLATPGAVALGLIMGTDVLLVCCWSLALYTLWRAIETPRAKLHWWLLTMLLVGLGSLSKQMMMLFPVLMILYLLIGGEDRRHLKQRWPWLLWGGSLLFLLPPLWWNFRHDWITFKHTAHHIEPSGTNLLDHLKTFGEFVGGQMGLLSPITWLLLVLLLLLLLPLLFKQSRQVRFLFVFGAVGLLGFAGFSFKQSINPNWPATFYPAGLLLLAAWGRDQVNAGFIDRLRKWFVPALKFGVVLTLIAYLLPFVLQLSVIPLGRKDPSGRIKGWSELGQQVGATLQEQPRPEQTFVISPLRKYPAAVAFYTPGHPVTYKWSGNPRLVTSQYDLWPGPVDKLGWDALILHNADSELPKELLEIFENVVPLGEKVIPIGAAGERKYLMWRGENLLFWPENH
ncbi:MAG TPA: glycosyltransferase family 39 protein [Malonomonas sp.]